MTGIIDVGGGMRDIYGAGAYDRFLDDNISFDCCVGVSAGSGNLISFIAGQRDRAYRFYCEYSFRKQYMSFGNYFKNGSYIDFDYPYDKISVTSGEDPLDYNAFSLYKGKFFVVTTDAQTGEAVYFDGMNMPIDKYDPIKASGTLPVVCKPRNINNRLYYDGGVAEPVPLDKALEEGCDKIVLILTRPRNFRMIHGKESLVSKLIRGKYPDTAAALDRRAGKYNTAVERAVELEKQGKCLILAPDDCCGIDTLTKDKEKLDKLYHKGYEDAGAVKEFVG